MSTTFQPTGLQMQGNRSNAPYNGALTKYVLTTNNATAIGKGDPVALVAGSITTVTANPAAGTLSANSPIGVAMAFEYNDPNRGFVCSSFLAAGAVSTLGYTNIIVLVADDSNARFTIQANGSVAASAVGKNIDMGGFSAATSTFKVSGVYAVAADVATTNTLPLRILGIDEDVSNAAGDSFTKLIVSWNTTTHSLTLPTAH